MVRIFSITLICLLSTSCSFRKLAFRNADWIANYEADRFFDPKSGPQTKQMEAIIDQALARTRSHFLPRVNLLLNEIKTTAEDQVTDKEWASLFETTYRLRRDFLTELVEMGTPFLVTLDDKQLQHLQKELEESNEDLADLVESKKFEKHFRRKQNRTVSFYKDLFGSLTDEQKEIILSNTAQSREQVQQLLNGRREMQKSFASLIRQHRDVPTLQKELQLWIDDPKSIGSADYEEARQQRTVRNEKLLRELEGSLSAKQRTHMLKEIDSWIGDFEQLAAR